MTIGKTEKLNQPEPYGATTDKKFAYLPPRALKKTMDPIGASTT
jgi:hypothetical protein